jgi:hypothetical protein
VDEAVEVEEVDEADEIDEIDETDQADQTGQSSQEHKNVTALEFYSYRLMVRDNGNMIHFYGNLLHQYAVDMYVKIEQGRLSYIERNQKKLRTDLYKGMIDSMRVDDTNMSEIGKRFILPSSFIGGPRHMAQLYQDALSIVRKLGKPDLFVTFTCNPKWPEITEALGAGQYAADRPDLVSRVFKLKLKSLMSDLVDKKVLGKVIGHIHVIEFQKRVSHICTQKITQCC